MPVTKLKSVSLRDAVMFSGQSCRQITLGSPIAGTSLEISTSGQFVLVKPGNPERETLHVPMMNVTCCVIIDADLEAEKKAHLEKKLAKQGEKARKIAAVQALEPEKPVIRGTIKFVKDPVTGAITETIV